MTLKTRFLAALQHLDFAGFWYELRRHEMSDIEAQELWTRIMGQHMQDLVYADFLRHSTLVEEETLH